MPLPSFPDLRLTCKMYYGGQPIDKIFIGDFFYWPRCFDEDPLEPFIEVNQILGRTMVINGEITVVEGEYGWYEDGSTGTWYYGWISTDGSTSPTPSSNYLEYSHFTRVNPTTGRVVSSEGSIKRVQCVEGDDAIFEITIGNLGAGATINFEALSDTATLGIDFGAEYFKYSIDNGTTWLDVPTGFMTAQSSYLVKIDTVWDNEINELKEYFLLKVTLHQDGEEYIAMGIGEIENKTEAPPVPGDCSGVPGSTTTDTDPFNDNSLVAKYLFDGNASDLLGNHNGSVYGSSTFINGKFGKAVDFGSSRQTSKYVRINNVPITQNMTYSIWFNRHVGNSGANSIFSLADSGTDNRILLWVNSSGTWLSIRINNASDRGVSLNFTNNVWNHLVMTMSSSGANNIYLNGINVGTINSGPVSTYYSNNNILILGQEQDCRGGCFSSSQCFLGALDQFEIYNRTLTQEEVCALYNAQAGVYCDIKSFRVLIDENTTHDDLALIGDDSELDTTARYTDSTYGLGWGQPADNWNYRYLKLNEDNYPGASKLEITYSGTYNNPSGGLGKLIVSSEDENSTYLHFQDAWADSSDGQTLIVNQNTIFNKSQQDIANRSDILQIINPNIKIGMAGYGSGYGYTKRYIKNLNIIYCDIEECNCTYTEDILGDNSIKFFYPMCGQEPLTETQAGKNAVISAETYKTYLEYNGVSYPALIAREANQIRFPVVYRLNSDVSTNYSYSLIIKIEFYKNATLRMQQGQNTNGTVILGSSNLYGLYVYNERLYYSQYNAAYNFSHIDFGPISDLADGEAHSLIFSRDDSNHTISIYLDGVFYNSGNISSTVNNGYSPQHIVNQLTGNHGGEPNVGLGGLIVANLRFYNRPLVQNDVDIIVNDTMGCATNCTGLGEIYIKDIDPFNDNSLVAKYLFENSLEDLLGNYDGSTSGTTNYIDSNFGKGVRLIGHSAGDRISTGVPVSFPMTISYWGKNTTPYKGIGNYSYNGYSGSATGFGISSSRNAVEFYGRGPTVHWGRATSIPIDEWYHIVVLIANETDIPRVFFNGKELFNPTGNYGHIYTSSRAFGFGYEEETGYGDFSGNIDTVEIYNRLLTEEEICQIYNTTTVAPLCTTLPDGTQWCITANTYDTGNETAFRQGIRDEFGSNATFLDWNDCVDYYNQYGHVNGRLEPLGKIQMPNGRPGAYITRNGNFTQSGSRKYFIDEEGKYYNSSFSAFGSLGINQGIHGGNVLDMGSWYSSYAYGYVKIPN